ncbi:CPXV046 protein [Cowpox virus]|uniref:CPXV046 protein n=1 Tax=Cowpox virus TaxID=10243 RepID=U5TNU0_COWPX|nr:CPXV046 protein [Cowpox virus]
MATKSDYEDACFLLC